MDLNAIYAQRYYTYPIILLINYTLDTPTTIRNRRVGELRVEFNITRLVCVQRSIGYTPPYHRVRALPYTETILPVLSSIHAYSILRTRDVFDDLPSSDGSGGGGTRVRFPGDPGTLVPAGAVWHYTAIINRALPSVSTLSVTVTAATSYETIFALSR
ncbi:uncharacterized protein N7459_002861 [Penicillium hispanicum]|uniref:uncharacterized protein n=1 Tax=Penicillium hispanicum TaxID=1080232 RepID=UPI0025407E5B|nr:uncharacterized protein N7459_002861 [Penicillium hispanicum]KAJ5587096.1 hypothetical protein N7459_002861 [Penicillium hispanicum]